MRRKRERPNPVLQHKILQQSYLKKEMIQQLYGIGNNKAYEIIKQVRKKFNYQNLLSQNPILIEKNHVLELYPLDIKGINKAYEEHKKMQKEKTLPTTN